jgi:hypothetical protein
MKGYVLQRCPGSSREKEGCLSYPLDPGGHGSLLHPPSAPPLPCWHRACAEPTPFRDAEQGRGRPRRRTQPQWRRPCSRRRRRSREGGADGSSLPPQHMAAGAASTYEVRARASERRKEGRRIRSTSAPELRRSAPPTAGAPPVPHAPRHAPPPPDPLKGPCDA